ncbi:MAG TPA: hypothetical protein DCY07_08165 [Rhodospirillaceae bacterium]|nr:hypothetical protein [Rhodospirillaceae bacterium]
MKTDARISLAAMTAFAGIVFAVAAPVFAQNEVAQTNSVVQADVAVVSPAVAPAAASSAAPAAKESIDSINIKEKAKDAKVKDEEGASSGEIPDSVKDVVERLNTATKDVTIEDLNSAREAVVKLDVLIDIEKRLNDLATLRQEREEKANEVAADATYGAAGMGGGAPMAPPALMPAPQGSPTAPPVPAMAFPEKDIEVSKVVGASGRYMATIKDADGTSRQVRVGDKLLDGSVVDAISRSGVTVVSPSKKRNTIQVKDIGTVFGG